MHLYVVRHGETDLNKQKRMQGITDISLNETGLNQAMQIKEKMKGEIFNAVYASPYIRTIKTAAIIANVKESEVITDVRLSEVDFGKYEQRRFRSLGLFMTLHWLYPEIFPAPKTVEGLQHVTARVLSFLSDLKEQRYENVLICSHGNLIRVLNRELGGGTEKISWRSFPDNCEVNTFSI